MSVRFRNTPKALLLRWKTKSFLFVIRKRNTQILFIAG